MNNSDLSSNSNSERNEIDSLREKIDSINSSIIQLLKERQETAIKIGNLKDKERKSSSKNKLDAYDPQREEQIIASVLESPLAASISSKGLEAIFRQIISTCRNAAHQSTVCILKGTDAIKFEAEKRFGSASEFLNFKDEDDFIATLSSNDFNIGLVPQNSSPNFLVKLGFLDFKQVGTLGESLIYILNH